MREFTGDIGEATRTQQLVKRLAVSRNGGEFDSAGMLLRVLGRIAAQACGTASRQSSAGDSRRRDSGGAANSDCGERGAGETGDRDRDGTGTLPVHVVARNTTIQAIAPSSARSMEFFGQLDGRRRGQVCETTEHGKFKHRNGQRPLRIPNPPAVNRQSMD